MPCNCEVDVKNGPEHLNDCKLRLSTAQQSNETGMNSQNGHRPHRKLFGDDDEIQKKEQSEAVNEDSVRLFFIYFVDLV